MNGISVLILSLVAVMRMSEGCVDYSAHPNGNCKSFIRCVGDTEYVMTCGEGTVFNPVYKVCDWPQNVECPASKTTPAPKPKQTTPEASTAAPEASTAAPEASTAAPEASTAAPEASTAAPEESTAAPEATTPAPEATTPAPEVTTAAPEATTESLLYPPCPSNIPMEGKYPDLESKCRSYYVCNQGVVTKKDCPDGLLYEIWTQMCQLENLVTSCKLM